MASTFLDELLIGAEVDPSGITRGLASAVQQLQQFDRQVEQIISQTLKLSVDVAPVAPTIDTTAFLAGVRAGIQDGLAELEGTIPPVVIPAPVVAPINPPDPPDFSETIAEAIRAADVMRAEFLTAFPTQALGVEAKAGAVVVANQLEAGLLAKVGELRDLVATGIISPVAFTVQVDAAIAAMAREIEAKQASLPELVLRVRAGAAGDTGVITEADLASVTAFDHIAQAEQRVNAVTRDGERAFNSHSRAVNTARNSLVVLASQAVGTSSTLGQLAQSALLFAGGSVAVIATAGAVLAVVTAYDLLTGAARKSEAEIQKTVDAVRRLREGAGGPIAAAERSQAAVEKALERQRALLVAESGAAGGVPDALTKSWQDRLQFAIAPLLGHIRDTQGEINALTLDHVTAAQAVAQALTDAANAQAEFQRQAQESRITALAEAPGLGTDTPTSIRQRAIELDRLRGIIASQTASLTERNAATRQFNALVEGAQVPLDRQRRAALDIAAAQASAYHDVAQAFADAISVVQRAINSLGQDEFSKIIAKQKADAGSIASLGPISVGGGISDAFGEAEASTRDLNDELEKAIAASGRFGRRVVTDANDGRKAHERLNDAIHDVTGGLDQIVGAARNVGLIGDEASQAIGAVLNLGDAIGNVIEKASTGNILGLIGAGIGFVGSLLGSDSESDRIRRENNRLLAQLNVNLEKTQGLGSAASAQDLAATLAASKVFQLQGTKGDIRGQSTDALDAAIAAAGLSLDEFAKIINDTTGLEILDDHGRIIAKTLDQANEALKRYIETQTRFAATFEEQSQLADLRSRLAGESQAPADIFGRELNVADDFSDAIKRAFAGVDLGSEAAVRTAVVDLLDRFAAGQLTAEDLGLSKDDFLKFLNDAGRFLDSFNTATQEATKALSDFNVPTGFRTAALAFGAADFGSPARPGDGASIDFSGFQVPSRPTTHISVIFEAGSLVQSPGENATDFADRVIDALRVKVAAQSGGDSLLATGFN